MDTNGYLTLGEAAQELGVKRPTLYLWASVAGGKRLNIVTVYGRRVVSVAEVRRLKTERLRARAVVRP